MPPKRLYGRIRWRPPRNGENNLSRTFDAVNKEDPLKLLGSYLVDGKYRMAGEGRMMISSIV